MGLTFDSYGGIWPYLFILIAGGLAIDMWRLFGVVAGSLMREDSEGVIYVRSVAVAMAGAVIGSLVIFPAGSLAATPLLLRIAAIAAGWSAFWFAGRSILLGVAVGEAVLVGVWLLIA